MREAIVAGEFAVGVDLTIHARGHKGKPERTHIHALDLAWGIINPRAFIFEGRPGRRRQHPVRIIMTWGRSGRPLHIIVAVAPAGYSIVTYYEPSPDSGIWEADLVTRKRRHIANI